MKNMKEEKALLLYESIGNIDDGLAVSALNYRKVHSYKALKIALVLAACFAFMITMLVGGLRIIDSIMPEVPQLGDDAVSFDGLDSVLGARTDESLITDAENIDFFSGDVSIIWSDGENCYLKPLGTQNELAQLYSYIGKGERVEDETDNEYKIWISFGDGRVVSPYLANTPGNVGYATLFDYDPEIEPTSSFVEYIEGLLK